MLTLQGIYLLRMLKWAQKDEDDVCCLLTTDMKVGRADDKYHIFFSSKDRTKKIYFIKKSIDSILLYLEEEGYIEKPIKIADMDNKKGLYTCKVKHKGWHLWQMLLSDISSFLIKSVIVPIVVSLVTAIATYYLLPG